MHLHYFPTFHRNSQKLQTASNNKGASMLGFAKPYVVARYFSGQQLYGVERTRWISTYLLQKKNTQ